MPSWLKASNSQTLYHQMQRLTRVRDLAAVRANTAPSANPANQLTRFCVRTCDGLNIDRTQGLMFT
jgi:hypothetical protein